MTRSNRLTEPRFCGRITVCKEPGALIFIRPRSRHGPRSSSAGVPQELDSYSAFFENDRKTATGLMRYLKERGIGGSFSQAWPMTSACSGPPRMRDASASMVVVTDACRAIDLEGSAQAATVSLRDIGATLTDSHHFD